MLGDLTYPRATRVLLLSGLAKTETSILDAAISSAFVADRTRRHEEIVTSYQRQVYPRCMKMQKPYNWRERVRYEVRHGILTTQMTGAGV